MKKLALALAAMLAVTVPASAAPFNHGPLKLVFHKPVFKPPVFHKPIFHKPHFPKWPKWPPKPPKPPVVNPPAKQPVWSQRPESNKWVGPVVVGCVVSSAASAIVSSAMQPVRQLTPREAARAMGIGCPIFLPLMFLFPEDTPETYKVAAAAKAWADSPEGRRACEFNPSGCMARFTNAYAVVYSTGKAPAGM